MKRGNRQPGSTALEVFVLLSVVSLIGIVAIPSYLSYRTNKQANCIARQFRTFAAAFHHYADLHGTWPEDQIAGRIPLGMENELPEFANRPAIGGRWDWELSAVEQSPSICLIDPRGSAELIMRIDQILDDGNPASGSLVYRNNRIALKLQSQLNNP